MYIMKNLFKLSFFVLLLAVGNSCNTNKVTFQEVQKKIYSNNFSFVTVEYDKNLSFSAPSGTGRISQTNLPMSTLESVGVQVTHDKLTINLPATDQEVKVNKSSLKHISKDFTVARSNLENGNILLNFFLNDNNELNLIKMEIDKEGKIDCSIEGPKQKPLLYTGRLLL